jgi:large subunit ribosomal protein L20
MARVTNTPARQRRKRRLLKAAKGHWGAHSKLHKVLKENLHRSWAYAYKGRKLKKRDFRSIWIVRINAACRERGLSYSRFIKGLSTAGVTLDRKALSELAIHDPKGFDAVMGQAKAALA